jgi:hypothetical protein
VLGLAAREKKKNKGRKEGGAREKCPSASACAAVSERVRKRGCICATTKQ